MKVTKVQPTAAVPSASHVPDEEEDEDDGVVVFDELKTLEQRMVKAKQEFLRIQMQLDAYK